MNNLLSTICLLILTTAAHAVGPTLPRTYNPKSDSDLVPKAEPKLHSTPTSDLIAKSLRLLQHSAATYTENRKCFTCHHQALPAMTVALARERGFAVDDKAARAQSEFTHRYFEARRENLPKGNGVPGGAYTPGYGLVSLAADGWEADDTTQAMVEFIFRKQRDNGCFPMQSHRPPLEDSHFTATALSIRGVQLYASEDQQKEAKERIDKAREWLLQTEPKTNEDRTFQLFGLKWADADKAELQERVEAILTQQGKDGGWSQLSDMGSDAYATGQTLVALHQAGGLAVSDSAYQRGLEYLRKGRLDDGSWLVQSRSRAFQTYFESGFPHEKAQWISICATCWATMALMLAEDPDHRDTPKAPVTGEESRKEFPGRDRFMDTLRTPLGGFSLNPLHHSLSIAMFEK